VRQSAKADGFGWLANERRAISPGFPMGSQPLSAHDFAQQSLVCYAYPPNDVKTCAAAIVGGAGLSGKKTGRDFRANSEKITACFR